MDKSRKLDGTNIFRGDKISQGDGTPTENRNGKWVEARPLGYIGFWYTLNCAWLVLTHRADIVIWYEYPKQYLESVMKEGEIIIPADKLGEATIEGVKSEGKCK